MIRYRLRCKKDHEFDAWFPSGAAYDKQVKSGLVACPDCGAELEVRETSPVALALAPEAQEDWGE